MRNYSQSAIQRRAARGGAAAGLRYRAAAAAGTGCTCDVTHLQRSRPTPLFRRQEAVVGRGEGREGDRQPADRGKNQTGGVGKEKQLLQGVMLEFTNGGLQTVVAMGRSCTGGSRGGGGIRGQCTPQRLKSAKMCTFL